MEDLKPQQKLGQYTVLRKLAEGGMAEIYLASRGGASGFSKSCVLKRVKSEHRDDDKFRAMFELEAKLAANLEHSNIVQIFDFQSSEDGELYLAMQYVDGCSLEELRKRLPNKVMPPFLAARIARDVASALAYAFTAPGPDGKPLGLVHRDVSPHNVLVSRQGEVKLTDFGIAKPVSSTTTGVNIKGKIAYLAPEQARPPGRVDARTDIFALGVVLYELVTGSRPFEVDGNEVAQIMELATGYRKAARASSLGRPVPESLEDVLERALQRQPEHRFQTAEELARALDQVVRQAPSDVDTDLARFVTERLGPAVATTPTSVPQLQTGDFDPTHVKKPREPTAMLVEGGVLSGESTANTVIAGAQRASLGAVPAIAPSEAAPQAPLASQPAADTTSRAVPAFEPEPPPRASEPDTAPRSAPEITASDVDAAPDEPAAPLFTPGMKRGLGVAVPVVLVLAAFGAYRATRQTAAPEETVVKVAPPAAPEPKPQPKPQPVEPPKLEAKVEPPKAEEPPKVEPKPVEPPKVEAKVEEAPPVEAKPEASKATRHASLRTGKGTLQLSCFPYAEVYDGATKISEDGMQPVALAAGAHHLRFKHADQWANLRVEIPAGGRACATVSFNPGQPPTASATCGGK